MGEVHQRQAQSLNQPQAADAKRSTALFYFEKALQFVEKLLGHHPLIGKLVFTSFSVCTGLQPLIVCVASSFSQCSYLGRLNLELGTKPLGVQLLNRGYRVYKDFYGEGKFLSC